MKYNSKHLLIGLLLCLFIFYKVWILPYQSLPWVDETTFADTALHLNQTGRLEVSVLSGVAEPMLQYGFLYFFLVSLVFNTLGFGIGSFRLVTCLAAILFVGIWLRFYQRTHTSAPISKALVGILLLTDPFLSFTSGEGRMEWLAVALYWAGLGCFFFSKKYYWSLLFFLLALLTTPRIIVLLLPIFFFICWKVYKAPQSWVVWGIGLLFVMLGLYSWIWFAFGSYEAFWQYYASRYAINEISWRSRLGGNGYVPPQSRILIGLSICFLALQLLLLILKKVQLQLQPFHGLSILSLVIFYVVLYDFGPYSALVLGFWYLLLLVPFTNKIPFLHSLFIGLLLFHNLSYFSLKQIQILSSMAAKDPEQATLFVKKHVPTGSRVVGEPIYYYAVKQSGSDYQYTNIYGDLRITEYRQRTEWQYDYYIVTEQARWRYRDTVNYYLGQAKFEKVAVLSFQRSSWAKWIDSWNLLSTVDKEGYSATLYRRLKE
ncbi:MAG: hypothetical protein EAZ55_03505 [Cytophagales bacterium]|nr:MAG: hypothetical protein EAZ55_03505 [Cytophagales bacterium]